MKILVTGATGYIGGRLVPRLLEAGHQVRVLVRDPHRISARPWLGSVEVRRGDLLEPQSLERALEGIEVAYYLVHSMYSGPDFPERDRRAAQGFVQTGGALRLVIYLGGLLPSEGEPSVHLASRAEVGSILAAGLPVTEFRAGPIIGSGSASFELVRYLTERLPVVPAPGWMRNRVQPIAVRDILAYLLAALDHGPLGVVEVGTEPLSFGRMMREYARVRGLKRLFLPLPCLSPRLCAHWAGLITPVPASLAVPLFQGIIRNILADTRRARELFPEIAPSPYSLALARALQRISQEAVETRWSGALGGRDTYERSDYRGLVREIRTMYSAQPPEVVFDSLCGIGGERGWLAWGWAWALRGFLDRVLGGPGLRRGRRHPRELLPGEALDFWRVEAVERPRLLLLRAEMKVPGQAWLQWETIPEEPGTRLVQTAMFAPTGFWGAVYWYSLFAVHALIFSGLIRAVGREAEAVAAEQGAAAPATGASSGKPGRG